jgi:hypothetical protein
VWGWVFDLLIIVGSKYLTIKNSKNGRSSVFLFLGDLKNCSGPGFRKTKRGGYEIGVRVKILD